MWEVILQNKENVNFILGFIVGAFAGITLAIFFLRQNIKMGHDLNKIAKGFSDIAKSHSEETRKNLDLLQKQRESLEKEKAIFEAREVQKAVFGKN